MRRIGFTQDQVHLLRLPLILICFVGVVVWMTVYVTDAELEAEKMRLQAAQFNCETSCGNRR